MLSSFTWSFGVYLHIIVLNIHQNDVDEAAYPPKTSMACKRLLDDPIRRRLITLEVCVICIPNVDY